MNLRELKPFNLLLVFNFTLREFHSKNVKAKLLFNLFESCSNLSLSQPSDSTVPRGKTQLSQLLQRNATVSIETWEVL